MATLQLPSSPIELPKLPVSEKDFISYFNEHPKTPVSDLLAPFKTFENTLRKVYAQQPSHVALQDRFINTLPVFSGHEGKLRVRARSLENEAENERYIMPLAPSERKAHGAPAVVGSFKEFKNNFNLFSESALVDMDWSNVVAAGSSVVTALLPVPQKYGGSKRALREYYHEKLAPASDVDLFLYGLSEDEARQKIKQIETKIKDSILQETTTIRTKNAITIASQYPIRHVQIVLRLYQSVSEILTGFDIDCSCLAYDGTQVHGSPRAITALATQINTVDLSRRSPSYESRLSKYSHRGFEVYWPLLDRSRVDPTIFERSFARTLGLSRLLVLEKLPKPDDRDAYLIQRRAERGRPEFVRRYRKRLVGNIKEREPDDVPEWVEQEEASNYHTFQVPYGPKFHAKKIERLLYTKDLLLNAEWNQHEKDRHVDLHRHPCFFGDVDDILKDCCGHCPIPLTVDDEDVAAKEAKIYVSGPLRFITDDPGRQAIGSFNPLTEADWTDMAYVGNTARLCQAIVDGNLEHVQDWCSQAGAEMVNRRDHTGRTPLHLAAMISTPEVVQCLLDHGARIVARLTDGFTALHLAARRGNAPIVKALLIKSEANEEEAARRAELKKRSKRSNADEAKESKGEASLVDDDDDSNEVNVLDADDKSEDSLTMTEGSFVKIKPEELDQGETIPESEDMNGPDVYDVDVLAWDAPVSALHLAILGGHVDVVETLCSTFGADVLQPIKILNSPNRTFRVTSRATPRAAIMTLILAQLGHTDQSEAITKLLLRLGASSAQADMNHISALHFTVHQNNLGLLKDFFQDDEPAARSVLNHLSVDGYYLNPVVTSPLLTAIFARNATAVDLLLSLGAQTSVGCEDFVKALLYRLDQNKYSRGGPTLEVCQEIYKTAVQQPVVLAVELDLPTVAQELLQHGVDPSTLTKTGHSVLLNSQNRLHQTGTTLLDAIREELASLRDQESMNILDVPPEPLQPKDFYLAGLKHGTYQYWSAETDVEAAEIIIRKLQLNYEHKLQAQKESTNVEQNLAALQEVIRGFEITERMVLERGGKPFGELHPDIPHPEGKPPKHPYMAFPTAEAKAFEVTFDFRVPDQTDMKRAGYLQLFQAAWEGDSSKVKSLTLAPWGEEAKCPPLMIATWDTKGFSPFSIAVFRGHYGLAKIIVDIAHAQYQPSEEKRQRYSLEPIDDDDADESDNDTEVNLYSELVDDVFTIENLGAVADIVKSNVTPLHMLTAYLPLWRLPHEIIKQTDDPVLPLRDPTISSYSAWNRKPWNIFKDWWESRHYAQRSLLHYAVWRNDTTLSKFYLELGAMLSARRYESDSPSSLFQVDTNDFRYAFRKGRTTILAQIMKTTGAGIPLDAMVKDSGIELEEKAKYYQGLSIHGKKRKDWAQVRRRSTRKWVEPQNPPLLEAAYQGSVESTEWLLSDAPIRIYRQFAQNNEDDKRLETLSSAPGGINTMLNTWLTSRNQLALHCAVLSRAADEKTTELIKYLIEVMPESLEATSQDGWTPLLLAFSLHHFPAAQLLINAGANQRKRDREGRNIMHLVVVDTDNEPIRKEGDVKRLLALIEKPVLQDLFTERSTTSPGAQTPLARWLGSFEGRFPSSDTKGNTAVLRIILDCSLGKDLEIMDGSGQFPLHTAVKVSQCNFVETMLERNPTLLHRENTTGETPVELADRLYLQYHIRSPPHLDNGSKLVRKVYQRVETQPWFVHEEKAEPDVRRTWLVCKEAAGRFPGRRKLVSLNDANEVSKRLAKRQSEQNGEHVDDRLARAAEFRAQDEVSHWLREANRVRRSS